MGIWFRTYGILDNLLIAIKLKQQILLLNYSKFLVWKTRFDYE